MFLSFVSTSVSPFLLYKSLIASFPLSCSKHPSGTTNIQMFRLYHGKQPSIAKAVAAHNSAPERRVGTEGDHAQPEPEREVHELRRHVCAHNAVTLATMSFDHATDPGAGAMLK
jgi:hypothetical protein